MPVKKYGNHIKPLSSGNLFSPTSKFLPEELEYGENSRQINARKSICKPGALLKIRLKGKNNLKLPKEIKNFSSPRIKEKNNKKNKNKLNLGKETTF